MDTVTQSQGQTGRKSHHTKMRSNRTHGSQDAKPRLRKVKEGQKMQESRSSSETDTLSGQLIGKDGQQRKGRKRSMAWAGANSKHWFTTSFLQPLPYLVMPWGSRKLSANEQFLVGAQTVVSLLQTTQIKQGVSFIAANKAYTSTNKIIIV